jgi:hypothetical protein
MRDVETHVPDYDGSTDAVLSLQHLILPSARLAYMGSLPTTALMYFFHLILSLLLLLVGC